MYHIWERQKADIIQTNYTDFSIDFGWMVDIDGATDDTVLAVDICELFRNKPLFS
jgi:hypothetical protein